MVRCSFLTFVPLLCTKATACWGKGGRWSFAQSPPVFAVLTFKHEVFESALFPYLEIETVEVHPYSELFPMCSEEELMELRADIKRNGLLSPIVIDVEGRIIDGRNRHAACLAVGVEPVFEPFVGSDEQLLSYVLSANLTRRHLTPGQRAMVVQKLFPIYQAQAAERQKNSGGDKKSSKKTVVENLAQPIDAGKARDKAGAALNVSGKLIDMAVKVHEQAVPEIVEAVKGGAVAISAAAEVADLPAEVQRQIVSQGTDAVRKAASTQRKKRKCKPPLADSEPDGPGNLESRFRAFVERELDKLPPEDHQKALQVFDKVLSAYRTPFDPAVPPAESSGEKPEEWFGKPEPVQKHKQVLSLDQHFQVFWAAYPRKVAKKKAVESYAKAFKLLTATESAEEAAAKLLAGAKVYAERANPEALCHAATWLNQHRWEDDPDGIWNPTRASHNASNAMLGAFTESLSGSAEVF